MTIYYIVNARMPTPRAHGVNIAHMCAALAQCGHDVTLVVPRRFGARGSIADTYGVPDNFRVVRLPTIDLLPLHLPGAFALETFFFALSALLWLFFRKDKAVIYTRGEMPMLLAPFLPKRYAMVWETHIKPRVPSRYRLAASRCALLVAATKQYAAELPRLFSIDPSRVVYEPDAVDIVAFQKNEDRTSARTALALPQDKTIVMYTGSPQAWKGIGLLQEAADMLSEDFLTVFVGAFDKKGAEGRRWYAGHAPHARMPQYLAAADIVILTAAPDSDTARHYTSPLKMFEYMASGKPIVAVDVPSFRDILSDDAARFISGRDPHELARAIENLAGDSAAREALSRRARALVADYSWDMRAAHISEHMNHLS